MTDSSEPLSTPRPHGVNLNTPEGWIELHRETQIFSYESAILFLPCSTNAQAELAAAVLSLTVFDLKNAEGESRFKETIVLVPPGKELDKVRESVVAAVQALMRQGGVDELLIQLAPWSADFRALITMDSWNLVEVVRTMPFRSACVILRSDLLRFVALESPTNFTEGISLQVVATQHLERLMQELAKVATERGALLIVMCDQSRIHHAEIEGPDDFAFFALKGAEQTAPLMNTDPAKATDAFRAGGWPTVRALEGIDQQSEKDIAFKLFESFSETKELGFAWNAVAPYIEDPSAFTEGTLIALANAAYAAGDAKASHQLLGAINLDELQSVEELFGTFCLADSHQESELANRILNPLRRLYPGNPLTVRSEFMQAFRERNFSKALGIAEQLAMSVEAVECRAFLSPRIDADEFLSEMQKVGELEQALISCAEEAMYRQHGCQAIYWARQVPESHPLFERACLIRLRAVRVSFRKGAHMFSTKEVISLMAIVAARPGSPEPRGELERLLELGLEEPLVKVTLATILAEQVQRLGLTLDESIRAAEACADQVRRSAESPGEDQFQEFFTESSAMLASTAGPLKIGEGELLAKAKAMASKQLIGLMLHPNAHDELGADLQETGRYVHLVALTCKEAGDPNSDLLLVMGLVDRSAIMGTHDEACMLAETSLQFLPQSQPSFYTWRLSQGWACMAEAYLRAKNTMAAARYLCLSLLAHNGPAQSVELLRRWIRLAARILREFGFIPYALQCIAAERALLEKIGASQDSFVPLDVFILHAGLPDILSSEDATKLEAVKAVDELLAEDVASELYPLLGIQATILRFLSPEMIPADLRHQFEQRVETAQEPLRSIIRSTVSQTHTHESISAILRALPTAQNGRDLAFHISLALPACVKALHHSVSIGDPELFLVASMPFAQPSLGIHRLDGSVVTPEEPLVSAGRAIPRYSFAPLTEVRLEQLQQCLGENEGALILSGERGDKPFGLFVTRESISGPILFLNWSVEALHRWKLTFKTKLEWKEPRGFVPGIDSLEPPVRQIRDFFLGLGIEFDSIAQKLTIIPPSHLFGFTWMLSPFGTSFLCEQTSLAVAPSVAWLVMTRAGESSFTETRKAWIGSEATNDNTLIALRCYVEPCLEEHQFGISRDHGPVNFSRSELVFIGAHGGTGLADYFRSVTDRVNHFSPTGFAQMLQGCGCVILAVCSSGRSDRQSGTEETLGLVTALLRVGVRCVIAPPWPLDIEVVRYWLPEFLKAIDAGDTVGQAAAQARDAVRQRLDHPCAWGQMHLYGDQSFKIQSSATEPNRASSSIS